MSTSGIISNRIHYGFGFIPCTSPDQENCPPSPISGPWEPKQLATLLKEIPLPILTLGENLFQKCDGGLVSYSAFKCDVKMTVRSLPGNNGSTKCAHDLTRLVQQWVQSREKELLQCDNKYAVVVPIICSDKAVRYARTGEQFFNKKHKYGYAIKVRLINGGDNNPTKYYNWTVWRGTSSSDNEGEMFETYMCRDFYMKRAKLEKDFHFFSITSFDSIVLGRNIIYRFFCIGEIDGVQINQDNYDAVEIKSSSATIENFNRRKLSQYYAKCVVSQVPKLVIGMRSISSPTPQAACAAGEQFFNHNSPPQDTDTTSTVVNYQEIRLYDLKNCPTNMLDLQESNLTKAINLFHVNRRKVCPNEEKFLNGFVENSGIVDAYFADSPRINQ